MDFHASLHAKLPGLFSDRDISKPKSSQSLLHEGIDAEDVDQALIETGRCDVNATANGDTPLFLAAKHGELEMVKILLRHGADVTIKSKNKRTNPPAFTPLHAVIDGRHSWQELKDLSRYDELMQLLLDAGCDINAQDVTGNTMLLLCTRQEIPLVPFLLRHGADPNIAEHGGGTSAHFLHPLKNPECFKSLMAHGARLDISRDHEGHTPLHAYAAAWQLGNLSLLRPFVSDWSIIDGKGNTLLRITAARHLEGLETIQTITELLGKRLTIK